MHIPCLMFTKNILYITEMNFTLHQVKETLGTAESLLGDLAGFHGFRREATELIDEFQTYTRDQFEGWSSEMLSLIDDPKQPLR